MGKLIILQSTKKKNTLDLTGSNTSDSTIKYKYKYKDGVITVNITGVEREYYQKGSKAYEQALQKNDYSK